MRIWMEDSGNVPFTLIRSITEEEEESESLVSRRNGMMIVVKCKATWTAHAGA